MAPVITGIRPVPNRIETSLLVAIVMPRSLGAASESTSEVAVEIKKPAISANTLKPAIESTQPLASDITVPAPAPNTVVTAGMIATLR